MPKNQNAGSRSAAVFPTCARAEKEALISSKHEEIPLLLQKQHSSYEKRFWALGLDWRRK